MERLLALRLKMNFHLRCTTYYKYLDITLF